MHRVVGLCLEETGRQTSSTDSRFCTSFQSVVHYSTQRCGEREQLAGLAAAPLRRYKAHREPVVCQSLLMGVEQTTGDWRHPAAVAVVTLNPCRNNLCVSFRPVLSYYLEGSRKKPNQVATGSRLGVPGPCTWTLQGSSWKGNTCLKKNTQQQFLEETGSYVHITPIVRWKNFLLVNSIEKFLPLLAALQRTSTDMPRECPPILVQTIFPQTSSCCYTETYGKNRVPSWSPV